MSFIRYVVAIAALVFASIAAAADGLIVLASPYAAKATMDRLEEIVKKRGLNVFARIDHAAAMEAKTSAAMATT